MKNQLGIVFLATVALLCSCRHKCDDIVTPANLKPIDWNGWNDAYTVFYTYYDNDYDACHDHEGDTIMCYGHIAKYLYEDYSSLRPNDIFLEATDKRQQAVGVGFILQNSSETDSLKSLLNSSSHSDTCFIKGTLNLWGWDGPHQCRTVYPHITVHRIEDIYFK